jgi:hypothetical protein
VKTRWSTNLAEFSKEGCDSKRAVLQMMKMMVVVVMVMMMMMMIMVMVKAFDN